MKNKGFLAISPFFFFILFYVIASLIKGDFSSTPIVIAFLFASIYALVITSGHTIMERINIYTESAGNSNLIFMILIFVLAGVFASTASATGCVANTVNFILSVLPARFALASIFIAGCFLSFGSGSGIGTIVAIGPIAVGVAQILEIDMPLACAVVVCGAMFGDNLSFISDTTIVATTSQGCKLKDKFIINSRLVFPVAIVVTLIYMYIGQSVDALNDIPDYDVIKILPYVVVILLSLLGVNVLLTLLSGTLVSGIMGMFYGDFDFYGWMSFMSSGIDSMSPFITMILLATGLIGVIKYNGGIDYVVQKSLLLVKGTKSAEACICILTGLVCACTANNTIAVMSVGDIVKEISQKFSVDKRKAASLMDISSCIVQEILPYSAHLLAAAAFGAISTMEMLPYVFYAYGLVICQAIAIIFRLPRICRARE